MGTPINKKDIARMKVLEQMGESERSIGRRLGRSSRTVAKYLHKDLNDPQINKMVEEIREKELNDLYLLGAKARKNLHDLIDKNQLSAIPLIACQDRSFQQRRLLEGKSTANVNSLSAIVQRSYDAAINSLKEETDEKK